MTFSVSAKNSFLSVCKKTGFCILSLVFLNPAHAGVFGVSSISQLHEYDTALDLWTGKNRIANHGASSAGWDLYKEYFQDQTGSVFGISSNHELHEYASALDLWNGTNRIANHGTSSAGWDLNKEYFQDGTGSIFGVSSIHQLHEYASAIDLWTGTSMIANHGTSPAGWDLHKQIFGSVTLPSPDPCILNPSSCMPVSEPSSLPLLGAIISYLLLIFYRRKTKFQTRT